MYISASDLTGHCTTFLMSNHICRGQERCVPLDCARTVHWSFDYREVIKTQFRIIHNSFHVNLLTLFFVFFVFFWGRIFFLTHFISYELKSEIFYIYQNLKKKYFSATLIVEIKHSLSIRNTLIRNNPSNSSIIRNHYPLNFQS